MPGTMAVGRGDTRRAPIWTGKSSSRIVTPVKERLWFLPAAARVVPSIGSSVAGTGATTIVTGSKWGGLLSPLATQAGGEGDRSKEEDDASPPAPPPAGRRCGSTRGSSSAAFRCPPIVVAAERDAAVRDCSSDTSEMRPESKCRRCSGLTDNTAWLSTMLTAGGSGLLPRCAVSPPPPVIVGGGDAKVVERRDAFLGSAGQGTLVSVPSSRSSRYEIADVKEVSMNSDGNDPSPFCLSSSSLVGAQSCPSCMRTPALQSLMAADITCARNFDEKPAT